MKKTEFVFGELTGWATCLTCLVAVICDVVLGVCLCRNLPLPESPEWTDRFVIPAMVFFTVLIVKDVLIAAEGYKDSDGDLPHGIGWFAIGKTGLLLPGYWFVQHHNVFPAIYCLLPILAGWIIAGIISVIGICYQGFREIITKN